MKVNPMLDGAHRRRTGFSLAELLVVMGIIAVLVAMLLPAVATVRKRGQQVKCMATLRGIGQAAQLHVTDHGGFLPAAGWHWKPGGGVADAKGVGDEWGRRYTYYTDAGVKRPAPLTVSLGLCIGLKIRLDSREALEEDLLLPSLIQHFRCESQQTPLKGLTQKEDGSGWEAPRELSSYVFNEAILGKRDKPYETPMGKVTKIKRTSVVMLAMDGRPREIPYDDWLMIFDYGKDDTLYTWETKIQEGTLGKQSLDPLRHGGKLNVLYVDGHVDTVPMTRAGLESVGVTRGVYD